MPDPEQNGTTNSDTLHGWKDIASYLNRSARAVQRWERELGLPVHRIKATDGQTVYAKRAELDEWRTSRDLPKNGHEDLDDAAEAEEVEGPPSTAAIDTAVIHRASRTGLRLPWPAAGLISILLVVVGAAIGAYFARHNAGPMASIQVAGTSVVAYDSLGRVTWTTSVGQQVSRADGFDSASDMSGLFVDLEDDGEHEAIVPVRFAEAGQTSPLSDALMVFDRRGQVRWQLQPDLRLQCGSERFEGPWRIYAVRRSTGPGPKRVWVAFNHPSWWPSVIMEIDQVGEASLRMLHTGWIWDLAEWQTPSGTFLAVTGINNELDRPTVSLLDLDSRPAMSPHAKARFTCQSAPEALPRHVYLLPTLETGLPADSFAVQATVLASSLKVQIRSGSGTAIAEIGDDLQVKDFALTDSFWTAHRTLELKGLIDHPADTCPARSQPHTLDRWSAATGWNSSTIVPTIR